MKFRLYQPQAIHEVGKRKNQEDCIYPFLGTATSDSRLFLVCDGVGGYEKGELASSTVVNAFSSYVKSHCDLDSIFPDGMFSAALSAAYDALDAVDGESESQMGTTFTMLCFHRGGCLAAHIGDSRIYHLRPSTGEILYRSRDHSLVQQLFEMGEITYEEMKTSPKRNVVIRAMSPHQEARSKAELVHITDIRPGDYFYVCTDGMLEQMEDDSLLEILADRQTDDNQKCQQLLELTNSNGDNHSAYLIHIESVESEESDGFQPNDEAQARAANKVLNRAEVTIDDTTEAGDDDEPEPSVDNVEPSTATVPPQRRTTGSAALPPRRRPPKKSSNSKTYIILLIILLVAILTGFTIFNMMGKKKDTPVRTKAPVVEDPNRIEYKKEAPSPSEGAAEGYFPAAPEKQQPAIQVRDKQTEDVDNLLEDANRREQEKNRAEKEKAEKAKKEKLEEAVSPTSAVQTTSETTRKIQVTEKGVRLHPGQ